MYSTSRIMFLCLAVTLLCGYVAMQSPLHPVALHPGLGFGRSGLGPSMAPMVPLTGRPWLGSYGLGSYGLGSSSLGHYGHAYGVRGFNTGFGGVRGFNTGYGGVRGFGAGYGGVAGAYPFWDRRSFGNYWGAAPIGMLPIGYRPRDAYIHDDVVV